MHLLATVAGCRSACELLVHRLQTAAGRLDRCIILLWQLSFASREAGWWSSRSPSPCSLARSSAALSPHALLLRLGGTVAGVRLDGGRHPAHLPLGRLLRLDWCVLADLSRFALQR